MAYIAATDKPGVAIGHPLEIVPLTDPTVLAMGDKLQVQVLKDGKPLNGVVVSLDVMTDWDLSSPVTDDEGKTTITVQNNGMNVLQYYDESQVSEKESLGLQAVLFSWRTARLRNSAGGQPRATGDHRCTAMIAPYPPFQSYRSFEMSFQMPRLRGFLMAGVATLALTAIARADEAIVLVQLNEYVGDEAYFSLYLVNPEGKYEQTLWLSGPEKVWWPQTARWYGYFSRNAEDVDAITGASTPSGARSVMRLEIDPKFIDAGYSLRVEHR